MINKQNKPCRASPRLQTITVSVRWGDWSAQCAEVVVVLRHMLSTGRQVIKTLLLLLEA